LDNILLAIATGIVLLSVLMAAIRLLVGPSGPDRAVALDSLTIMSLSLIASIAVMASRIIYLDVALERGLS
jgi:multicomponent Na+:H+ antiporter subunit F